MNKTTKTTTAEVKTAVVDTADKTTAQPKKTARKPELNAGTYVPCVSNVRDGRLVYHSRRSPGYKVVWNNYMEEQLIELSELNAMKSTAASFFAKNWIVIPDSFELKDEVMDYLKIKHFYGNVIDPRTVNEIIFMDIPAMTERIMAMNDADRKLVEREARAAVENGTLDSFKRISALEQVLSCRLT